MKHLEPWLLAQARRLGRPELEELERDIQTPEVPVLGDGAGELVVVVETGKLPRRCIIERAEDQRVVSACPRPWVRGQARIEVGDTGWETETVTSLENLLLRRGNVGALLDSTRQANLWARVGSLSLFVLVPPLGAYLLTRSSIEHGTQIQQGWLSLPAEFQVARIPLPSGRQTVRVLRSGTELTREVDISARRLHVLVVPMN